MFQIPKNIKHILIQGRPQWNSMQSRLLKILLTKQSKLVILSHTYNLLILVLHSIVSIHFKIDSMKIKITMYLVTFSNLIYQLIQS